MKTNSQPLVATTLGIALGVIGLAVSLFGYARSAGETGDRIGAVALGAGIAAGVATITTVAVVLMSRRRWAAQEPRRFERAAARLAQSDPQTEFHYAPHTLSRLLDALVTDSARELDVASDSLAAQVLLLVGQGEGASADGREEFIWPEVSGERGTRLTTAARRAVQKNTPAAILAQSDERRPADQPHPAHHWIISVPIPSTQDSPPLGAITLSGSNEDLDTPRTIEDLQPLVSLMLNWARLAALQIGEPSTSSPSSEGGGDAD